MNPIPNPMHTNATSNFPEETPVRPLGRRRFLTTLGAITSVFALGMEPLMANPGDPAWDAAEREPAAAHLAHPSANQYAWHEQERTMFIHFGVATWEGTEYDSDGRNDLSRRSPHSPSHRQCGPSPLMPMPS